MCDYKMSIRGGMFKSYSSKCRGLVVDGTEYAIKCFKCRGYYCPQHIYVSSTSRICFNCKKSPRRYNDGEW